MDGPTKISQPSLSERLAVYRYFRGRWLDMLNGSDQHAICRQLTHLLATDLEFRTIDYSRKLCADAGVSQNGIVHKFIDQGFLAHQAFAIRRITEDSDSKKRDVYSLPRIIREMEECRNLLTRDAYVAIDVCNDESRRADSDTIMLHNAFDELSQVNGCDRSSDDKIHPEFYSRLRKRLTSSDKVRQYANKFLAHAADPFNRKGDYGFSCLDLEQVYVDLTWVTNQISARALYSACHIFLPSYIFDALEHIDTPICPPQMLEDLRAYWHRRENELRQLEENNSLG